MYDGKVVLCGANSYEEKYYLNPDFEQLPDDVKNELKIMCVLYVHDVGGILTLVFEEDGELCFEVSTEEFDPMFDEIGSQLKIKQLQREKQDLLQALQLYSILPGRRDKQRRVTRRQQTKQEEKDASCNRCRKHKYYTWCV